MTNGISLQSFYEPQTLPVDPTTRIPPATLPPIPDTLTQALINTDPDLHRFQQDLIILTSFNENDTLHWRPSWFQQAPFNSRFWTLYNPPNVVTEQLPQGYLGKKVYTRRMRHERDPPALYIKTWDDWNRVCDINGIPREFLSEKQVALMRLGLLRNQRGKLCKPPTQPIYPEPFPQRPYILDPSMYLSLPRKFQHLKPPDLPIASHDHPPPTQKVVVVHPDGELRITARGDIPNAVTQGFNIDGTGAATGTEHVCGKAASSNYLGQGRRWAYLPWTREMAESCVTRSFPESPKHPLPAKQADKSGLQSPPIAGKGKGKQKAEMKTPALETYRLRSETRGTQRAGQVETAAQDQNDRPTTSRKAARTANAIHKKKPQATRSGLADDAHSVDRKMLKEVTPARSLDKAVHGTDESGEVMEVDSGLGDGLRTTGEGHGSKEDAKQTTPAGLRRSSRLRIPARKPEG